MNGTPEGPTCRALFRAGEDDAPPYWMAFNEETSDRADRFSSLGMALSDVMPGAASAEIAGAHATGRVLAGEAAKLGGGEVTLRTRGWWITACRIVGMHGEEMVIAQGVGDGAVALAVEDLKRQITEVA